MKRIICLALVTAMVLTCGVVFASEYTGPAIQSKLASEEIDGDFMTVWGKKFAAEMKKWSGGKIDITVYPYGSLGDTRDINELCQLNVVNFVFSDHAWISSFVPQAQVLALNYLWPRQKVAETLEWVVKKGQFMKLLEKHFRAKGLVPLAVVYEGWQWITSKRPIKSMADMKGLKLRLMGSKLLVEDYKAYGASPTPMSYGEVYSGLQTGLIDAQVNPLFACYSMKFYEVQDYFTQIWAEPFLGIPTVNAQFFDSLPKNAQEKMRSFWINSIVPSGKWIDERNASDKAKIKKARSKVQFSVLDDSKVAEFKAKAESVYPTYPKIGGEEAQKVLDALLKDLEAAKKAVGAK